IAVEMRRDEAPDAVELCAVEADGQPTVSLLLEQLVRAAIPDLDRAGAVLALWDLALEVRVVERMVLDVDGKMPLAALERNALRDSPARKGAAPLEAEVVMQPPSGVPLDDEDGLPAAAARERLRRALGIALAPVLRQAHRSIMPLRDQF